MSISAIIITLNEENNIAECLKSLSWADEIIVVDSGSTDKTVDLAGENGAKVLFRKFDDFSSQKNFALDNASSEWILSVDADERINTALAEEIKAVSVDRGHEGYFIPRKNIIFGREMKYGGHQNDKHLRLFRRDSGRFVSPIHESVKGKGVIGILSNPIVHYSTFSRQEYLGKLRQYTDMEADLMVSSRKKVYRHYILTRPAAIFAKRYFFQKGFLDGWKGLEFYFLSAFYEFMKYSKYFKKIKDQEISGRV
jgi:glycosyltransferase involved in cell wall biosynthesis